MKLARVAVVLHRPSSADNLGAAARAMKNFGLSDLRVVAPPSWQGLPRSRTEPPGSARRRAERERAEHANAGTVPRTTARAEVLLRARTLARKAVDLLERARIVGEPAEALGDLTWVCGTTSRAVEGRPRLDARELAAEVALRSEAGPVGVLFGEERRGLSDRELELCQAVCTIPTSAAYDSMNLAQSVAVVSYELAMAARAAPLAQPAPAEPARMETVEHLWRELARLLAEVGFLNPQNPEHILADFRRLLGRASATQREVELVLAALKQIDFALKKKTAAREDRRP